MASAFRKWLIEKAFPDPATQGLVQYEYCGEGWQAALKWYQSIAAGCEKDCQTDEDYKTLYFHLKQVLKNGIQEDYGMPPLGDI
ncbi:hypothetical protein LCGC14_0423030 [marine sediment metagenome]|uniref:Uncharacterized protein n=1 Tax=marine sediment metagenome TaxID=412755 RepID=A0A0F9SQI5_9ZZZZ